MFLRISLSQTLVLLLNRLDWMKLFSSFLVYYVERKITLPICRIAVDKVDFPSFHLEEILIVSNEIVLAIKCYGKDTYSLPDYVYNFSLNNDLRLIMYPRENPEGDFPFRTTSYLKGHSGSLLFSFLSSRYPRTYSACMIV